jgi:hypothetical protein
LSLSPSSGVKLSSTFLRVLFRSLFLLFTLIQPFRLSLSEISAPMMMMMMMML